MRIKPSICIFVHYRLKENIPSYVKIFVDELSLHFDEIRIITNERLISNNSFSDKVSITFEKNEGYDFGKFYKFIKSEDISKYSQIALVNDSNVLINKLDKVFEWGKNNNADFWGLVDSNERPWFSTNEGNYHIQSHFLVFNEKAISELPSFIESLETEKIFSEKNQKLLRRLVINQWEIGLSQFFIRKGLKTDSFLKSSDHEHYLKKKEKNITHSIPEKLLSQGYPLIKNKIFIQFNSGTKNLTNNIEKEILKHGCKDWDLYLIINELKEMQLKKKIINFRIKGLFKSQKN